MKAVSDNSSQGVQSLVRALEILEALKDKESMRLTELQQQLSLSKGTLHRYLSTLAARGYVVQNARDRSYRLGLKAFHLASAVFDSYFLRESVRDYLKELRDLSEESIHLGVMDRGEVVYLDRVESTAPVHAKYELGQREPLHATALGKALLAFRLEEEVRSTLTSFNLPGFTRNTITNVDVLLQHLSLVRQRGYAIANEEHSLHLCSFAFPVRDRMGEVIAAVSIDGPSFRFTLERIAALTEDFLLIAKAISARLGYRGPLPQTKGEEEKKSALEENALSHDMA